jgi:alpha-L-glutamate ligase-like protein
MFNRYKKLHQNGILCINQRNADYVLKYNARARYPIVDDKLKTKKLAIKSGIAVPELYGVITTEHQVKQVGNLVKDYDDFVVKPAHGAGGDGIIVITNKVENKFRKINGSLLSESELAYHLSCILSGAYSLGGHPDYAIIEHRVIVDTVFDTVSYEGIPDIRIIVLLGYPVMAMVRLPTRQSEGKANLHQGAIGAGIDLACGTTLGGVWYNDTISHHPDTLNSIADIKVPSWDNILHIAASCYELTGLGYLGVDIVLDKTHGPLMLELNARPGLNIQIANRRGLLHDYRRIENRASRQESVDARINFSKNLC